MWSSSSSLQSDWFVRVNEWFVRVNEWFVRVNECGGSSLSDLVVEKIVPYLEECIFTQ